ncbi:14711_t:CDS:1, partial [Funneliformis geosporum]
LTDNERGQINNDSCTVNTIILKGNSKEQAGHINQFLRGSSEKNQLELERIRAERSIITDMDTRAY